MHVKLNKQLYFDRKSVAKSDHGVMVMKKYIERERGKVRVECGEEGVERQRMYTGELGCASGWEGEGGEWNDVKREHHLL